MVNSTVHSVNLAAVSPLAPHSVKALSEPAFLDKSLFEAGDLPVQQAARYGDQGQRSVRGDLGEGGHNGLSPSILSTITTRGSYTGSLARCAFYRTSPPKPPNLALRRPNPECNALGNYLRPIITRSESDRTRTIRTRTPRTRGDSTWTGPSSARKHPALSHQLPDPSSLYRSHLGHSLTRCHQCSSRSRYFCGLGIRSASDWLPSDLSGQRWRCFSTPTFLAIWETVCSAFTA
jgi:hypothetical protein